LFVLMIFALILVKGEREDFVFSKGRGFKD
jgi:hypothetical protein